MRSCRPRTSPRRPRPTMMPSSRVQPAMSKTKRALAEAEQIAAAVIADLSPFGLRRADAGRRRRQKPGVGDPEIVAIPRWETAGGLCGHRPVSPLGQHLHDTERYQCRKGDAPSGRYYHLHLPEGMQLDLFLEHP